MSIPCENVHSRVMDNPSMDDIAAVVQDALRKRYAEAACEVGSCPDLREFGFVAEGLGGAAEYVEVGGVFQSMFNPAKQQDVPTIPNVGAAIGAKDAFVIGQGAGSYVEVGCNSEWVGNAILKDGKMGENGSRVGYITDMAQLPQKVSVKVGGATGEFGCIGNLLYTDGAKGDVIKVHAKVRTDARREGGDPHEQEFVRYIREALGGFDAQVCLAGVLLVVEGKTVTHVMPPYFPPAGAKPGKSWPDMKGWAECFFESDKALIGTTTILNHQGADLPNGLKWRLDHTHFWTKGDEECGHYHYDIDPERIEYAAYLVPAATMHKVEVGGMPQTWPLKACC